MAEVTELEKADCEVGPRLIKRAPRSVKKVVGDGVYDTVEYYKSAHVRGLQLVMRLHAVGLS